MPPAAPETKIVGPEIDMAAAAPLCLQLRQIVTNLALEAKFCIHWPARFVPLVCACIQIIILIVVKCALPDTFMNHPCCSPGELVNGQRTLANNRIVRVCFCHAAGHFGAKSPGRHETIEMWANKDGNEHCMERLNQIIGWVIKHFGGKTSEITAELKKHQLGKNASKRQSHRGGGPYTSIEGALRQ